LYGVQKIKAADSLTADLSLYTLNLTAVLTEHFKKQYDAARGEPSAANSARNPGGTTPTSSGSSAPITPPPDDLVKKPPMFDAFVNKLKEAKRLLEVLCVRSVACGSAKRDDSSDVLRRKCPKRKQKKRMVLV
jgi:hypothetical protein